MTKSYAAPVLRSLSLTLAAGEVHALVGENGAGKSTLCRILAGLTPADEGAISLDGAPYAPRSKRDAAQRGVRLVLQELSLIGTLSVAENIFLPALPARAGWIWRDRLRHEARQALAAVGLQDLDPDRPAATLGIGQRQLVEIAAALVGPCRVLLLDEPTAALTPAEAEAVFSQVRRLRAEGVSVVYVSHRLEELRQIADRVSVLRDGALVRTVAAAETTPDELVRWMAGRAVTPAAETAEKSGNVEEAPVALEVKGLRAPPAVEEATFTVRRGEILGLAGLMGAGRTETLRAIFGAARREAGEIRVAGTPAPLRTPAEAASRGLGFVTEDRKEEGLLLPRPVRENVSLASLGAFRGPGGLVRQDAERAQTSFWIDRLGIRCRDGEQPVAELSGGNQQKTILARWLARDADILLLDEPTRGIDVAARQDLYDLFRSLARAGKALVVASSDLNELLLLCDRIAVLSRGVLVATFSRAQFSQEAILSAALSRHHQRAHEERVG